MSKFKLLTAVFGNGSPAAAVTPATGEDGTAQEPTRFKVGASVDAGEGGDDEVEVVSVTEAKQAIASARAEGVAAGAKAERERTAAVLGSEEGKANYATAAFMLNTSPGATAEQINGHLKAHPAPAAPAAPAPSASAEADRLKSALEGSGGEKVTTGGPKAENGSGEGADDTGKLWDQSRERSGSVLTGGAFGNVSTGGKDGMTGVRRGG